MAILHFHLSGVAKTPKRFIAFASFSLFLKLIFNENVYITKWLSARSSFKMKKSMSDFQQPKSLTKQKKLSTYLLQKYARRRLLGCKEPARLVWASS